MNNRSAEVQHRSDQRVCCNEGDRQIRFGIEDNLCGKSFRAQKIGCRAHARLGIALDQSDSGGWEIELLRDFRRRQVNDRADRLTGFL